MNAPLPRLEDHVRMFHAACGGIVVGPLDDLVCAECGEQMMAFVSAAEENMLGAAIGVRAAKGREIANLWNALEQLTPDCREGETNAAAAAQPLHGEAEASEREDR